MYKKINCFGEDLLMEQKRQLSDYQCVCVIYKNYCSMEVIEREKNV